MKEIKKYNGLRLTPTKFAEILIELFDGKQFERQYAIKKVVEYFQYNGGIKENKDYTSVFKKASQRLQENGLINKGYGIWSLNYVIKETEIVLENKVDVITDINIDKCIGQGEFAIYVYYFDVYKKIAEKENKNIWECKIGRTDKNPIERILNQVGTAYPELPHIGLVIKCQDSIKLENVLHSVLKYQDRWIESAPGNEWFLTSPEEIENIYYSILENKKGK